MDKLKLSQAVIVEGKYDKIKLSALLDAVIITTEGFGIFKDKQLSELIRQYAMTSGIVILTDSDAAGFKIRGHIKGICPQGKISNIYIPDVYGKEKRKTEPSKEGKLGVEGIDLDTLRRLFQEAGLLEEKAPALPQMTIGELYELGLAGGNNSAALRRETAKALNLPERITSKALLEAINNIFGRDRALEAVEKVKKEMEH